MSSRRQTLATLNPALSCHEEEKAEVKSKYLLLPLLSSLEKLVVRVLKEQLRDCGLPPVQLIGSQALGLGAFETSDVDVAVGVPDVGSLESVVSSIQSFLRGQSISFTPEDQPGGRFGSLLRCARFPGLEIPVDVLVIHLQDFDNWCAAHRVWQSKTQTERAEIEKRKAETVALGGFELRSFKRELYVALSPLLDSWFPQNLAPGDMCGAAHARGRKCSKRRLEGSPFCFYHSPGQEGWQLGSRFGPKLHWDKKWLDSLRLTGRVISLSGPSCVGKSITCNAIENELGKDQVMRVVSCTTRKIRAGKEEEGKDYFFCSTDEFQEWKENSVFFQSGEHYGNFYGKPAYPLLCALLQGKTVLIDVHPDTVACYRALLPKPWQLLSIYLVPPFDDVDVLARRHEGRGTARSAVAVRLDAAKQELGKLRDESNFEFRSLFQKVIVCGKGPETASDITDTVRDVQSAVKRWKGQAIEMSIFSSV